MDENHGNGPEMALAAHQKMQFPPFVSAVEAPFWTVLARRVLEEWRLCTDPVPVLGYYGPVSGPFDAQCSILSPSRSGLPSIAPSRLS